MRVTGLLLAVLVLLVMAAVPLWLALVSMAGFAMPWFLFGLAAWAVCRGPRRRRWAARDWQPRPLSASPVPYPRQAPPRPQPARARAELPVDVQVKVEQIRHKIEVLLSYAPRFPPFSRDLYLVRRTASDYLPRTIDAYLALPPGYGERVATVNGRTALAELKAQLDLLDAKLDDIAEDVQRRDMDRLLANRRFLELRFSRPAAEAPSEPQAPRAQSA